jgi:hypothetical protein
MSVSDVPGTVTAGQDGTVLKITSTTAEHHVVTVGALKVNGAANGVLTFGGGIGNSVTLTAYNGEWLTSNLNGVVVS